MAEFSDYTEEYKNKTRPEINKRLLRIFISFIGCAVILVIAALIVDLYKLPSQIVVVLFILCAMFYLRQVFSLKEIICPHCEKPLFVALSIKKVPIVYKTYVGKHCPHCGVKLR